MLSGIQSLLHAESRTAAESLDGASGRGWLRADHYRQSADQSDVRDANTGVYSRRRWPVVGHHVCQDAAGRSVSHVYAYVSADGEICCYKWLYIQLLTELFTRYRLLPQRN
jgi:hypothetical protein